MFIPRTIPFLARLLSLSHIQARSPPSNREVKLAPLASLPSPDSLGLSHQTYDQVQEYAKDTTSPSETPLQYTNANPNSPTTAAPAKTEKLPLPTDHVYGAGYNSTIACLLHIQHTLHTTKGPSSKVVTRGLCKHVAVAFERVLGDRKCKRTVNMTNPEEPVAYTFLGWGTAHGNGDLIMGMRRRAVIP
ncbi:hypothetical protein B0T14DRAFT_563821 [Immersiella caudata]|uniref:Uncharacterized protein n=1 Tax=Immersiella caudata TaxID=314043 RepID=A0AA39WVG9_9PEZI|nr:hypothetical protein B0T14DRAFT_563821 [Immersiella caudata]